MIERLVDLVDQVRVLQTKLILVIGQDPSGKTSILRPLSRRTGAPLVSVGAELGRGLTVVPQKQRQLQAANILRYLADRQPSGDLLLFDHIELLFDHSLKLDPLDLLKRHARARCVVAIWPGELQGDSKSGRLTYADMGHPEHRDYGIAGVVPFIVHH